MTDRHDDKNRRRRHRLDQRDRARRIPTARRSGHPELLDQLRQALDAPHPLALLSLASGVLAVHDERRDPWRKEPVPRLADFLESLYGTDLRETTALLAVLGELIPDELTRLRCRRVVAARRHPLPRWITGMGDVRPVGATLLLEPAEDADMRWVELAWPDGSPLTLTALIDRNEGFALTDCQVLDLTRDDLRRLMFENRVDGLDLTTIADADLADTRACVEAAIELTSLLIPPIETPTWPMIRPLLEWALRLLPKGGSASQQAEVTDAERRRIWRAFARSPFAADAGPDAEDIIETLCWFAEHNCGDPLRWSPRKIEILFTGWWSSKIFADEAYHRAMPQTLRAFVRYSAQVKKLPADVLAANLAAVDHFASDFLRGHVKGRRGGYADRIAEQLAYPLPENGLDFVADRVGGHAAMETLDTVPLPVDEETDLTGVPSDIADAVGSIVSLCDGVAQEHFDLEFRTACRRLIAQAARFDPAFFRRKASPATAAYAAAYLVAQENDLLGVNKGITAKALTAAFDLKNTPTQRVDTLAAVLRHGGWWTPFGHLGQLSLLTSEGRRRLIKSREFWRDRPMP